MDYLEKILDSKRPDGDNSTKSRTQSRKGLHKQKRKQQDPRDRPKLRQVSFFIDGETLYEQIRTQGGVSCFLAFDTITGRSWKAGELKLMDELIVPIGGDDVALGAVKLPSGIAKYRSTRSLLSEIEFHLKFYLDASPAFLKFAAYYILLTWLYDRFTTLPYLRALGDTGTGKSRFLDVIGGLTYKPISASGCVTPAPIYRMLRKWGGTLILDEADMKKSDEYNEVVTILNCGFEKGRPVIRATKDNPDKIQILPVYGPKVFATRRRFQDAALEARCLTEIMTETDREDIPPVLGKHFFEEQQRLRDKLLLFRFGNYYKVDPEAGAKLEIPSIEPRLRQVSEAFLSLFAEDLDVIEDFKSFIANHQKELIEQRAGTKTGRVVEALFRLMEGNEVTMVTAATGDNLVDVTSKEIAEEVGITPQAVGQILKGLGLTTKLSKVSGVTKRRIVYDEAKLKKLRRRYIPEVCEEGVETQPCEECDKKQLLLSDETESSLSTVTDVTNVTLVTSERSEKQKQAHSPFPLSDETER